MEGVKYRCNGRANIGSSVSCEGIEIDGISPEPILFLLDFDLEELVEHGQLLDVGEEAFLAEDHFPLGVAVLVEAEELAEGDGSVAEGVDQDLALEGDVGPLVGEGVGAVALVLVVVLLVLDGLLLREVVAGLGY